MHRASDKMHSRIDRALICVLGIHVPNQIARMDPARRARRPSLRGSARLGAHLKTSTFLERHARARTHTPPQNPFILISPLPSPQQSVLTHVLT